MEERVKRKGGTMDLQLKDKVVIVTGASQGLGKAIATEYAREGANVYISSRSEDKLQRAVQEIKQESGQDNVHYAICDMSKDDDIKQLVQTVVNKHGTIDVLINNAGGPPPGGFLDVSDDDWYYAFEQNLLSVVRATRYALPYMKKNERGRIVNITSSSIKEPIDDLVLSNTMRPGVHGLTKSLAREFAPDKILINTVGAGRIATDRMIQLNEDEAARRDVPFEEVLQESVADIPYGRYGEPDEFAKAVLFLGSFANTYITGQALIVDGAYVRAL